MNITEVGKRYGLSADTLRYYERIGLIPPVPRTKGGVRDYDAASLGWVELIKCMRSAGVGIEALIEYSRLFQRGEETMEERKAGWTRKLRITSGALPARSGSCGSTRWKKEKRRAEGRAFFERALFFALAFLAETGYSDKRIFRF